MSENILKTRIQLKYDTYANWQSSPLILKKGEIGVAEMPREQSNTGLTPPAIGIKVGNGTDTFANLPWIQAVAGDVSAWAKTPQKPTYTADEIASLDQYINQKVENTNTQYKIVKGTLENDGKYLLQKKDVEDEDYSNVEGSVIDLTEIISNISSLQSAIEEIDVSEQITTAIEALDAPDNAVANQFVTKVSEDNGIITVERAALSKEAIPAIDQTQVTGLSDALAAKQDTLVFNTPYNAESNKAATMSDISTAIEGISGGMQFKGKLEELPGDTSGYQNGDVILVKGKQYVAYENEWIEMGADGNYAIKGDIKDADIAEDANIAQSKVSGLTDALAAKVDKTVADETYVAKDGTKHLMSDEQDSKLESIEENAQVNKIESISVNGQDVEISDKKAKITIDIPSGALASKDNVSENELEATLAEKINGKVDKTALADIATSGEVRDLKQTDDTILVFDCGSATTVI